MVRSLLLVIEFEVTVCSIGHGRRRSVILITTRGKHKGRKEADPGEIIKITKGRARALLGCDVRDAECVQNQENKGSDGFEKEGRLGSFDLEPDDNERKYKADRPDDNAQLGPAAKDLTDEGLLAIIFENIGRGSQDDECGR